MLYTEKHGLMMPEQDDYYDIDYVKHNMGIIDKKLGEQWQQNITEMSEDGQTITTTYEDGSYTVTTATDSMITTETFDSNGVLTKKRIVTIDGNRIEEREVAV